MWSATMPIIRGSLQFLPIYLCLSLSGLPSNAAFQQHAPILGVFKQNNWPSTYTNQKTSPTVTVLADIPTANGPTYENAGLQRIDPDFSVLGLTENQALTYVATGSKCLDLFFDATPHIGKEQLINLLEAAWEEDGLMTLKIIFQLGDPRRGKGDRNNHYRCLLWMYEQHFETLLLNLEHVRAFSCYKTMLDLLVLVARGPDALDDKRPPKTGKWSMARSMARKETHRLNVDFFFASLPPNVAPEMTRDSVYDETFGRWKDKELRDLFVDFIEAQDKEKSTKAAVIRRHKRISMINHANELYASNLDFRRLYDKVADIFATDLYFERKRYDDGKNSLSGLVAKWAPSPKGSHDKQTNICKGIISRLYKSEDFAGKEDIRCKYQRDLSLLRRAAGIPESFIGSSDWHLVNYKRMPSRCRYIFGEMFRRHDQKRYDDYLEEAKLQAEKGERVTMVAAGALLPHEISSNAERNRSESNEELGLQWLRLVQDVKDKGKLSNALAICDVSGSMTGIPMDVAIALSLLVADTSEGDWSRRVITFSGSPSLVAIPRATVDNLASRVSFLRGIDWGYNTDFQKVFNILLEDAKERRLLPDQMPSILFCFSDMEFDQAHEGNWKTDLELIRSKYKEANYKVPQIVFWNLRPSRSKPASKFEPGVAMLSGFSAGLVKAFLEFRLEDFNPMTQMENMLRIYDRLKVADGDDGKETDKSKTQI